MWYKYLKKRWAPYLWHCFCVQGPKIDKMKNNKCITHSSFWTCYWKHTCFFVWPYISSHNAFHLGLLTVFRRCEIFNALHLICKYSTQYDKSSTLFNISKQTNPCGNCQISASISLFESNKFDIVYFFLHIHFIKIFDSQHSWFKDLFLKLGNFVKLLIS